MTFRVGDSILALVVSGPQGLRSRPMATNAAGTRIVCPIRLDIRQGTFQTGDAMSMEYRAHSAAVSRMPHIVASAKAAANLADLCRAHGPQVILLANSCGTVRVARVRSRPGFRPHEYEVLIGRVMDCPVYADTRQLPQRPFDTIVLDVGWRSGDTASADQDPHFVTRPESQAERQQRIFSDQARRQR